MNYSLYLQGGGSVQAPVSDEQALAHQKQVDNQMAEAIKLNPASLDQAVQDYGEEAPAFIKHMIDVAAENQDGELLEILKPYAEKFNISAFRCGGKVRAKVKKAKCGKKMEKGGEAPIKKEAKGGKPCPCTLLHKVGGKLIEVDCNGIPVAKNGTVMKFLTPSEPITYTNFWNSDSFKYDPSSRKMYRKNGEDYQEISWEDLSQLNGAQTFAEKLYKAGYTNPVENVYLNAERPLSSGRATYSWGNLNNFNTGTYKNIAYNNGKYLSDTSELSDQQIWQMAQNDPKMMEWLYSHNKYGYKGNEIDYKEGKATWDPSKMKYIYKVPQKQQVIQSLSSLIQNSNSSNLNNNFGPGKSGKFGGLTYNKDGWLVFNNGTYAYTDPVTENTYYDNGRVLVNNVGMQNYNINELLANSTKDVIRDFAAHKFNVSGLIPAEENAQQKVQNPQYRGLFSGDLRSYQSRKNWVDEHKDYLKEKGANINWDNYSGTAEQNLALKRLLGGFDEWNAAKQVQAKPYVTPSTPVLNPGAFRKDYLTVAPYTDVNPIYRKKDGGKMSYSDYLK